jgi:hypothetical protein
MNMRALANLLVVGSIFFGVLDARADGVVSATAPAITYEVSLKTAADKITAMRAQAASLNKAASEAPTTKLTPEQQVELQKYDAWIRSSAERITKLAAGWEAKVEAIRTGCEKSASCNKATTSKTLQETNMSFNMQYLQLQSQMQHENRSYTAISSIMRTKHDTVKNSISNVR